MKKLMIAFAAVAMAACAQAVQVKWSSGVFYAPDANGSIGASWNGTKWVYSQPTVSLKGSIEAFVWESATALTADAGDLYKWYADGKDTTKMPVAGTLYTGDNASSASAIAVNGGSAYSVNDIVYSAVLYVYTDGDGAKWYMENYANVQMKSSATTQNFLADFQGGGTGTATSTPMSWQSVPEPTSGLLLLLGVAGLALRRRRA